jgi:hypothetical protein
VDGKLLGRLIHRFEGTTNSLSAGEVASLFDNWCVTNQGCHLNRLSRQEFVEIHNKFLDLCEELDSLGEDIYEHSYHAWHDKEEWESDDSQ